ncbi:MAG: HlyD family efflux transporter periplasmic adaptor subunit [Granulosicoccus sp.]|nr:HlyD family efflux transporter periplasmic adaptor subunit [Granulosicoccus sp.]
MKRQGAAGISYSTHPFPVGSSAPAAAMLVARKVMASGRVLSVRLNGSAGTGKVLLAIPLSFTSQPVDHVLVFSGPSLPAEQRESCIRLCRWASAWLHSPPPSGNATNGLSLASLLTQPTALSVAMAMVNTLKLEYACRRVSLAVRRPGSSGLHLMAMSDQSGIDQRRVLACQIVAAMQEMLDAGAPRAFHGRLTDARSDRFPECLRLFEDQGRLPSFACVVAESAKGLSIEGLPPPEATVVVILLEHAPDLLPGPAQRTAIEELVEPACRLLIGRLREQTSLLRRLREKTCLWLNATYLRSLTNRQLVYALSALLAVGVLVWPVPQRISARVMIEARDLQVLVAPQAGFIASSHARAGDRVAKGQLLATLDDQDLTLAVSKWHSEATKNRQALNMALASRDRVELGRLRADAERIAAEQSLVERQLTRARLRAPFDGVVLSGDLSQQLGSSVVQGDTLFTVGSTDAYRLILDVDERDVGLVSSGQLARVRLAALPNRTWQARVEAVLPVATDTEDGIVFQVPARLDEATDVVRPGMEGVAKLQVGTRSLVWVYTRRLRETVKLWFWHLGLIR